MRTLRSACLALALLGPSATGATVPDEAVAAPGAAKATDQPPLKMDRDALRTNRDFESRCARCHSLGAGAIIGPDLAGVTVRRSVDWLTRWLSAPQAMLETDVEARALLREYGTRMPDPQLSAEDVRRFIRYFRWFDSRPGAEDRN